MKTQTNSFIFYVTKNIKVYTIKKKKKKNLFILRSSITLRYINTLCGCILLCNLKQNTTTQTAKTIASYHLNYLWLGSCLYWGCLQNQRL